MKTDEKIAIRRAEPGDEADIGYVHVAAWRHTYRDLLPAEVLTRPTVQQRSGYWRRVVDGRERDQLAYVALDEAQQIVGFASSGPQRGLVPGFDAELYDIFLLPDVQRRGIGRRLVKTVGEVMLDRGFSALSVWVVAENPSCKFCSALGATPVAEKVIDLEGLALPAVAYGWPSLTTIL